LGLWSDGLSAGGLLLRSPDRVAVGGQLSAEQPGERSPAQARALALAVRGLAAGAPDAGLRVSGVLCDRGPAAPAPAWQKTLRRSDFFGLRCALRCRSIRTGVLAAGRSWRVAWLEHLAADRSAAHRRRLRGTSSPPEAPSARRGVDIRQRAGIARRRAGSGSRRKARGDSKRWLSPQAFGVDSRQVSHTCRGLASNCEIGG